jgi:CelD/BcsL family acetyltransferase involved in cellulose biosynthesis
LRLELDDPRWLDLVERSPAAVAFHHPAWARLIADCYRYRSFALAIADESGQLTAGVPIVEVATRLTGRKWVSLPFTDSCSPLAADATVLDALVRELEIQRSEARVGRVEVRQHLPGASVARRSDFVLHRLELDADPDRLWRRFPSELRRLIGLARRGGVEVSFATRRSELVDTFYGLQLRTRRRQGVPIQPRRFFEMLWDRMIEPGLGFCLLAHVRERPIAGAVCLAWNGTVTGKYAASDPEFWFLRPNHLLVWEVIAWSCENGFRELDFGRSEIDNPGLRVFKSRWRALEEPLVYSALGRAPQKRRAFPRAFAAAIIRRSPAGLCRLAGEALYKYAA